MSSGRSCAPCFLPANLGVCCYSKIWRFFINSPCSDVSRANRNFARRIVFFGLPSGGGGQTGKRVCSSSNPKRSSRGIGLAFVCSGDGNPERAAADPPLTANLSNSFGECGPAIHVGQQTN